MFFKKMVALDDTWTLVVHFASPSRGRQKSHKTNSGVEERNSWEQGEKLTEEIKKGLLFYLLRICERLEMLQSFFFSNGSLCHQSTTFELDIMCLLERLVLGLSIKTGRKHFIRYSEIPLLRPPKIKTSYLLKTVFAKFKLFFPSFSTHSVHLIRDHLWDCPKVVFKTTFGRSQRWS